MPRSTLAKLPVDTSHMRPSTIRLRAFDGRRREVIGDIENVVLLHAVSVSVGESGTPCSDMS